MIPWILSVIQGVKKMVKKRRKWIVLLFLVLLPVLGAGVYISDYYHADQTALEALVPDEVTEITETDFGWCFDGPGNDTAMIFYPGGKVEETAYAPLLHELASAGTDVFLVKMPARLAVFSIDKAGSIMDRYDYRHWYIGGHSLGGASAAYFAEKNASRLDGLILLASYSAKKLDDDLDVLLVFGSADGVLNMQKYRENRKNVSADAEEYIIEGGNHCQFGSYGFQSGDGMASIPAAEQVHETVSSITEFMAENDN